MKGSFDNVKEADVSSSLADAFRTKDRDDWFDILSANDVPVGKVYSFDEVFRDPQILFRQMVVEVGHPKLGKIRQTGIPIKLSHTPGKIRPASCIYGANTNELLLEIGYSQEQIQVFQQTGVVEDTKRRIQKI